MFKKFLLKELYIEDLNFANNMVEPFKTFSKKYNFLLKPRYPSFVDEIKRQLWFSKNILIKGLGLNKVTELVANLIYSNFKNGDLITDSNICLIKFLEEKKTDKIYKIISFVPGNWHYSTLGENSILSVRFKIRKKIFSKKILIKYFQGYMSETAFTFTTYNDTMQRNQAKLRFHAQANLIKLKIQTVINKYKESH